MNALTLLEFIGPIFALIIMIISLVLMLLVIILAIRRWTKNNNSPRLSVKATVVFKRMKVSGHGYEDYSETSTFYYATFQVESGDRMEFRISGHEYGLLVEGDIGTLSFQGTRYLSFIRN